jgi:hypothetical protein
MTRADRRHNGKHRGNSFGEKFLGIPRSAYDAPQFATLKPWSVRLLIDLVAQYNGRNNGDLTAAWKVLKPRGWNSEATLNKAKKELLAAGYIVEMRKGQRPNLCSLYALTWRPLDPSAKHDFGPGGFLDVPVPGRGNSTADKCARARAGAKRGDCYAARSIAACIASRREAGQAVLLHRV